ncbi:MAG: YicC family protein [Gemmataceae bacterium]|nr:YicC family protein [Gemmataceae bacterium]
MLLSMTGFGESRGGAAALAYRFEVRSVNNRHLKLNLRAPEPYGLFEAEFEKVVRRFVRRGTILIQLRIDRQSRGEDFRLNKVALQSYVRQIADAWGGLESSNRPTLESMLQGVLALPGVTGEQGNTADAESEWPILEAGLADALTRLQAMRADEGGRMATQLEAWRNEIMGHVDVVRDRQPTVAAGFRDRLRERVKNLLADNAAQLRDEDLAREVALYADRSDIAEEIVRLDSHLAQFGEVLRGNDDSIGRKLEFVAQEMGRETNTMGAKAGDIEISRQVVAIKAVLEKIREMLQNVE